MGGGMSDDEKFDAGPPDDTPVTWGDLRRVAKLVSQYHNAVAMMTTVGLANALKGERTDVQTKLEADVTESAVRLSKELAALIPGADR